MRSLIALVLLPAVLAQGCATAATSNPAAPPASSVGAAQPRPTDPAKLEAITDLAGDVATIELTGGEVVERAESIRLGTEVTSWHEASGRERTVPTAEVRRVLREQRRLIGRGFGYGTAAAVLPAYLVLQNSVCHHRGCSGSIWGTESGFVGAALVIVAGGVIGMAVAAANRHPVVVYSGPAVQHAAAIPGSSTIQHCRLPSSATSSLLDCGSR
jgi:hypothetical protein